MRANPEPTNAAPTILDIAAQGEPAQRLASKSLAEIFSEWKVIHDQFGRNGSSVMFDLYGDVLIDLEDRMASAGVYSRADALAVIEWHQQAFQESIYEWDFDAHKGVSGAMWKATQAWLSENRVPPTPDRSQDRTA